MNIILKSPIRFLSGPEMKHENKKSPCFQNLFKINIICSEFR